MQDISTNRQIVYTLHLTYKLDEDIQFLLQGMADDELELNKHRSTIWNFIDISGVPQYEIKKYLSLPDLEKEINSYTQEFSDIFVDILKEKERENYTALIGISTIYEDESESHIFYNISVTVMVLKNEALYSEFIDVKPRKKDSLSDAQNFIFNTIKKISSERLAWLGYVILNYIHPKEYTK